jgi:hypothetical protein
MIELGGDRRRGVGWSACIRAADKEGLCRV